MKRLGIVPVVVALLVSLGGPSGALPGSSREGPGDITLVSTSDSGVKANGGSGLPSISADGTKVAFQTKARNLDPIDRDNLSDIYVKDLVTGDITLVSTSDAGVKGNQDSNNPWISGDGAMVAFESEATNLDPADPSPSWDVYVKDLATGDIMLACTTDQGVKEDSQCENASMTADGSTVAFETLSSLEPMDTNGAMDVYVKDLLTGNVSIESTNRAGAPGNDSSFRPAISADGTKVGFSSYANNFDPRDRDQITDTYIKDILTGQIAVLPIADRGVKSNDASDLVSLSADGTKIAFMSWASNLDRGDPDDKTDIYVKDLVARHLTLVSTSDSGVKGNDDSSAPSISADGTVVAFYTHAWNLDPLDTNPDLDIYVKSLTTGDITLASTSDSGVKGNAGSFDPTLMPDASGLALTSAATNFDPIDVDRVPDIYVKELA